MLPPMSLLKTLQNRPLIQRNAKRFAEIVGVLSRYGLAGWITEGTPLFLRKHFQGPEGEDLASQTPAARLRLACAELGPTFIKLGQTLSTRGDLVGVEVATELSKLQADVPADAPEVVRQTITDELGRPPEELFAEFEAQAFASASIGQVHAARLEDGTPVVVKVQHPNIEEDVASDLQILSVLAEFGERHDAEFKLYQPQRMVAEFERSLLRELDYGREAGHLQTFTENFAGDDTVRLPRLHPELSSRRVLTMERLVGTSVGDPDRIEALGYDTREVARKGADVWIRMILEDGFFHADPHPGNILVLEDGTLGVLDCGMVSRVDARLSDAFEQLVLALMRKDAEELAETVLTLCSAPPGLDRDAYGADIDEFCAEYVSGSLENFEFGAAAEDATDLVRRHHLTLASGLSQLLRTLALLEGTSRRLDRDFDLVGLLRPHAERIAKERLSPKHMAGRLLKRLRSWERLIDTAPDDLREILERARRGTFDIHLQHRNLDTVVNRAVQGLLVGSLFLGGSLLLAQRVPPRLGEVSVLGAGALLAAGWLGFRLQRAVRRSGGLGRGDRP